MAVRLVIAALAVLGAQAAQAQTWPSKPIRIIVAFAPGGSTDVSTRLIADRIAPALGQLLVVENRAGANGNVGAEAVVRSPTDGYTFLATADALASNPHLYKMTFDATKDLAPVIQLTRQPVVLAAHPSVGVKTIKELIAVAKRRPGMAIANSGAGSQQHIVAEWFAQRAGIQLTHVPYKGGGQAISDLVGGQVPLGSLGNTPVLPHYRAGKLRILAQSTKARSASLPDVPTYEQAGYPGLVLDQWLGLFAPAGTPREAIQRMNAEVEKALADPAIRERFAQGGLEPIGGSSEQFAKLYRDDYEKYGRLVKQLNVKID
jgi:tripartite-type tricarboxylate transporter receptor subunit TctC